MRIVLLGAAIAAMSTAAGASNDYLGQLSRQTTPNWIQVSGDNLTCQVESNDTGYVPVEWATATIKLPGYIGSVLQHPEASQYSNVARQSARRLCQLVAGVKASANADGYVAAELTSKVDVRLSVRYGGGCSRDLSEEITVTFANGLKLKSQDIRILAGGSEDQADCRRGTN